MQPRPIAILGSTGSIGTTALTVVSNHPDRFKVVALAAGDQIDLVAQQVKTYRPKLVSTRTFEGMKQLQEKTAALPGICYAYGTAGAEKVASHPEVHTVLSAIVGAAGLRPTVAAVRAGKTIGLANKESMVVAGALVSQLAKEHNSTILPVDSEHNAIYQAIGSNPHKSIRRLLLTASGGPFFLQRDLDLSTVTREAALAHPNWKMGEKITIDSATMMNKGLEIIEAHWLFGFSPSQIDAVIHPQSVIHSMVEYVDGAIIAQLGVPDMAGPIAFALSYPDRLHQVMPKLDFSKTRELTFYDPDDQRFPSISLARKALESGETYPAVLNGSNEESVAAFLQEKIGFLDISRINHDVLSSYRQVSAATLEDYIEADAWGRAEARKAIEQQ